MAVLDFQALVDSSKSDAIEELNKLKEIEDQIELAEDTTREAENAIGNAKTDAIMAEEIAVQAQNEAKSVSEVIIVTNAQFDLRACLNLHVTLLLQRNRFFFNSRTEVSIDFFSR